MIISSLGLFFSVSPPLSGARLTIRFHPPWCSTDRIDLERNKLVLLLHGGGLSTFRTQHKRLNINSQVSNKRAGCSEKTDLFPRHMRWEWSRLGGFSCNLSDGTHRSRGIEDTLFQVKNQEDGVASTPCWTVLGLILNVYNQRKPRHYLLLNEMYILYVASDESVW